MASNGSKNINAALLAVQAELHPIKRSAENPFHKSKYVDLAILFETVQPILNRHGIVVFQNPSMHAADGSSLPVVMVTTQLVHAESGTQVSGDLAMPAGARTAQAVGSAITYARRYALMAMVGAVAEGEDDDGNEASKVSAPSARRPVPQANPSVAPKPEKHEWDLLHSLLAEWRGLTTEQYEKRNVMVVATTFAKSRKLASYTKASVNEQIKAIQNFMDNEGNLEPEELAVARMAAGELQANGKAA